MPDARCTRGLMRNVHRKCAHEHTGQRRAKAEGESAPRVGIPSSVQQQIANAPSLIVNGSAGPLNPHPYNNYPDKTTDAQLPLSGYGYTTYDVPNSSPSRGLTRLIIE